MQQPYQPDTCTLSSSTSSPLFDYYASLSPAIYGGGLGNSASAISFAPDLEHGPEGVAGSSSKRSAATIKLKKRSQKYMDDEEKRKKFLERNRQAAVKSRQRKKQLLTDLQAKTDYLTADNEKLQVHICMLREEVVSLRQLLYTHHDCPITSQNQHQHHQSSVFTPPSPPTSQQPPAYKGPADYSPYNHLLQQEASEMGIIPSSQCEAKSIIPTSLVLATAGQQIVRPWY